MSNIHVSRLATAAAVTLALLMLLVSVWLAYGNLQNAAVSDALGKQVGEAQPAAETLVSTLKDAETGQRGYLLTGDPNYLEPYLAARGRLEGDFARLDQAPLGDLDRSARIARMRQGATDKLAELGQTVALRQAGRADAALAVVRTNEGKRIMDALRVEADALKADTRLKLTQVQTRARSAWAWIQPAGLGVLASLLLIGVGLEQRRERRTIARNLARLERFTHAFRLTHGMMREPNGRITFWNLGSEQLYGYAPEQAVGRISHELLQTGFPRPLAEIETILLRDGHWQGELVHRRRDGVAITVVSKWTFHRGTAGKADAVIEVNTDVTALKQAEEQRERSNTLLRAVVEAAPGLIYAKDREGRMLLANPPVMRLVGKSWAEIEGRSDLEFLDDKVQAREVVANDHRVMEADQIEVVEELVGGDGLLARVWLSTKTPLHDKDGAVIGLVGVSVEITERKQAEKRLRLMVHELNHRVKNTLATVQAIAAQTLRGADPEIRRNLEARLQALASAHDVLTAERWEGADLSEVVDKILAPHRNADDDRFTVSGEPMRLAPRAALALALGLHELLTNALKYGALSIQAGRVDIRWEVFPGKVPLFHLTWTERGSPPVRFPIQRGFGLRLIERSLAQDLTGTARVDFTPPGMSCFIQAPLTEVAAGHDIVLKQVG